jgi:hypothetical protein
MAPATQRRGSNTVGFTRVIGPAYAIFDVIIAPT